MIPPTTNYTSPMPADQSQSEQTPPPSESPCQTRRKWRVLLGQLLSCRPSAAQLRILGERVIDSLISSKTALGIVGGILLVQLASLGLGLAHQWRQMSAELLHVQQLKLEEAQILADATSSQGGKRNAQPQLTTPDPHNSDPDSANPQLVARDVDTILEQEDMSDILKRLAEEDQQRLAAAQQQSRQQGGATSAPPSPANAEAKREEEFQRLCHEGMTALIAGDMRRCILSLSQASTIHPKDPALLYYHALAYDKLLNPDKAQEYYMELFNMRDQAGEYFQKASQRLTYGFANPEAMRGKLAFGAHLTRIDYQVERGESVEVVFPILLAPEEDIRPEDVYIHIQFFDLTKGGDIQLSHHDPVMTWQNTTPTWESGEERLMVNYSIPVPTQEQLDAFGEMKYYGFTAKLYYRGEPLDCISTPSSLILREYQLRNAQNQPQQSGNYDLLPDDNIFSEDEATPASDQGHFLLPGAGSDGLLPE